MHLSVSTTGSPLGPMMASTRPGREWPVTSHRIRLSATSTHTELKCSPCSRSVWPGDADLDDPRLEVPAIGTDSSPITNTHHSNRKVVVGWLPTLNK